MKKALSDRIPKNPNIQKNWKAENQWEAKNPNNKSKQYKKSGKTAKI